MVPKVKAVWEDFVSGNLSLDDVTLRLKIQFPNAWMSGTQIIGI